MYIHIQASLVKCQAIYYENYALEPIELLLESARKADLKAFKRCQAQIKEIY